MVLFCRSLDGSVMKERRIVSASNVCFIKGQVRRGSKVTSTLYDVSRQMLLNGVVTGHFAPPKHM